MAGYFSPCGYNRSGYKSDGLEGNWVELRGHYISATLLKKPLPQNFTLSYDLVAAQNFTWGAKGLTMQLAKETSPGNAESFLNLRLRPALMVEMEKPYLKQNSHRHPVIQMVPNGMLPTDFPTIKK